MDRSILSLEQTPPLAVPLLFMLTAPFFAVLAAALVLIYPDSFTSRWSPVMLAVTHLITLGFITMVMVGAMQQMFPVLVGVQLPTPTLTARVVYSGLVMGILALCTGFLGMHPVLLGLGALFLGLSIMLLIGMLLHALVQSKATPMVTRGMKLAIVSFLLTIVLGLCLVADYVFPYFSLQRQLTSLHVGWGLLGWIGLLIFTISYQLVPMFQVTPKYPDKMVNWLAPCIFVVLVSVSVASLFDFQSREYGKNIIMAGEFFLVTAFVFYAVVTLWLQQKSKRKVPDVTMSFWRLGLTCLILACLLTLASGLGFFSAINLDLLIGVLMIVGFTMSLVTGMLYKIIPFLIWLHLTNAIDMRLRWQLKIPNMKKIIPDDRAQSQFILHFVAVALLLMSLAANFLITLAAGAFIVSNLTLAYNLIGGARVYRRVIAQVSAIDGSSIEKS